MTTKGRSGGVLPINAATIKKPPSNSKSTPRSPAVKLRLIIRRLPPGLTESELWEGLGSEWQGGHGKVDWFAFKPGKISKDPSKPSRPGRAYLKVKDQSLLDLLSAKVKQTQFRDAKNTSSDPCLIGPPSLEFAPYNKTPGGRIRHDGRQGTIDQDQEFIDFLQSLTEPISKPATNGTDSIDSRQDKVTTTPLVQFIKEKKANKAKDKDKEAGTAKGNRKQENKEAKSKPEPKTPVIVKSNTSAAEKARVAKATQDAVKAINKSVASMQTKTPTAKSEQKAKDSVPAQPPTPKRERERGSASAAARMISRDLGLSPREPRSARALRNAGPAASTSADSSTKVESAQPSQTTLPQAPVKPSTPTTANPAPPTGPRNTRAATPQQVKPVQAASQHQRQPKSTPQPTAGAKSAFLKHANPSQGVTEELLRSVFAQFGELTKCEIDKKKGLGYIDFNDTEALRKAMAASPVKVGNGQVMVLENKSPYRKGNPQSRSADKTAAAQAQPAASANVSAKSSPQVASASIAKTSDKLNASAEVAEDAGPSVSTSETSVKAVQDPNAQSNTTSAAATPTAPRGRHGRAGTNANAGRGNPTNRGGRAGFRSGRGGKGSRGANSAANQVTPVDQQPSGANAAIKQPSSEA